MGRASRPDPRGQWFQTTFSPGSLFMTLYFTSRVLNWSIASASNFASHWMNSVFAATSGAVPITFGYKAAVWLSAMLRHRRRLQEIKPRLLVGQFAGAAGTLASLGDKGLAVHDALMAELGLGSAAMPWHVGRDNLAEAVALLALIAGSLAKIATDIMLMMQTEVAEAFEPFQEGRGSSSTMPQKRNPIACEAIIAAARSVRSRAASISVAMSESLV